MKILVVEDDPGTRALIVRVASKCAESVLDVDNGLDALAVIEREDPDLLITDLHLPLFDGFELVTALRASVAHRRLPVICVSVIRDRDDIARLPALGIDDYLLKPVNPAQLDERIRRVLQKGSNWRTRDQAPDTEIHRAMIIDADQSYRALVRPVLEPAVEVLEASSGPAALTAFKELESKPDAIFIADDLAMLSATHLAELFTRVCAAASVAVPRFFLLSASVDPASAPPTGFTAIVRRTPNPEDFAANVQPWLPKAASLETAAVS